MYICILSVYMLYRYTFSTKKNKYVDKIHRKSIKNAGLGCTIIS